MDYDQIILISLDTLRSDCINQNPHKLWPEKYSLPFQLKTDLLDEIAKKSLFFTNAISAAPYTSASHATIFTGKWPLKHGLYEFYNKKLQSKTIFNVAQKLGYKTTFKIDFPLIFSKHLGLSDNVDNYIVEDDQKFIDSYDINIRNMSFVHFGGIHIPYGFHNLSYGGKDYKNKVEELESDIERFNITLKDQLIETYRNKEDLDLLLRYKRIVRQYYADNQYAKIFKMYLEGVNFFFKHRFDIFLTQLLHKLKDRNFLLVIFSDHGEEYDEESCGHFNTLSEGVVRVPVIFYHPGISPRTVHQRIRTIDIAPTLFDLMGHKLQKYLRHDGISLANYATDKNYNHCIDDAFSQAYVSEIQEFIEFQKKVLLSGKSGYLKHFKYKELVYNNNYKLMKQNYIFAEGNSTWAINKCEPIIKSAILDEYNDEFSISNAEINKKLLYKLDEYNNLLKTNKRHNTQITKQIVGQLINLGYLN